MPLYEFECTGGPRIVEMFPSSDIPRSIVCRCGEKAKKVISRPIFRMGKSMKHVTDDDSELEARRENRELCEWRIAMGVANGATGRGSMGPTAAGVKEKQERIKKGEAVPEEYTYGVDLEAVNATNCG